MKDKGVKVSFIHIIGNSKFEPVLGGSATQLNFIKFGPSLEHKTLAVNPGFTNQFLFNF